MTTLYKPVLIETAEQAEALPIGTLAHAPADDLGDAQACIRVEGGWHVTRETEICGEMYVMSHGSMVGDQALVPIDAEEETLWSGSRHLHTQTRYVTPWESV